MTASIGQRRRWWTADHSLLRQRDRGLAEVKWEPRADTARRKLKQRITLAYRLKLLGRARPLIVIDIASNSVRQTG